MDICSAIHALLNVRRCTPPFTASLLLLEDAKFQNVALWTTVLTGAVVLTGGAALGIVTAGGTVITIGTATAGICTLRSIIAYAETSKGEFLQFSRLMTPELAC
jgi:hypothetical protein